MFLQHFLPSLSSSSYSFSFTYFGKEGNIFIPLVQKAFFFTPFVHPVTFALTRAHVPLSLSLSLSLFSSASCFSLSVYRELDRVTSKQAVWKSISVESRGTFFLPKAYDVVVALFFFFWLPPVLHLMVGRTVKSSHTLACVTMTSCPSFLLLMSFILSFCT